MAISTKRLPAEQHFDDRKDHKEADNTGNSCADHAAALVAGVLHKQSVRPPSDAYAKNQGSKCVTHTIIIAYVPRKPVGWPLPPAPRSPARPSYPAALGTLLRHRRG